MPIRDTRVVHPEHKDKYYVYALCRPNGSPFYIGKGKGLRINHHFAAWNRNNKLKLSFIERYGDSVIRKILCYFDDSDESHEVEELLIKEFGLLSDGTGILSNFVRDREDAKKYLGKNHGGQKGNPNKKYSDETVLEALRLRHTFKLLTPDISKIVGIPQHYLANIFNGAKRKELSSLFPKTTHEDRASIMLRTSQRKRTSAKDMSDWEVILAYDKFRKKEVDYTKLADEYSVSEEYISSIFRGKTRPYLNLKGNYNGS